MVIQILPQVQQPCRQILQYNQQMLQRDHIWFLCIYFIRQTKIWIGNRNQTSNSISEGPLISDQRIFIRSCRNVTTAYISLLLDSGIFISALKLFPPPKKKQPTLTFEWNFFFSFIVCFVGLGTLTSSSMEVLKFIQSLLLWELHLHAGWSEGGGQSVHHGPSSTRQWTQFPEGWRAPGPGLTKVTASRISEQLRLVLQDYS